MNLKKFNRYSPTKIGNQLNIQNQVLATNDFYYSFLDFDLIKKASELAIHSRSNIDPIFDVSEIMGLTVSSLSARVYSALERQNFSYKTKFSVRIPKEKTIDRNINYIPIEQYVMRFMIALKLQDVVSFSENVFGGKEDVFEKRTGFIYDKIGQEFNSWQLDIINSNEVNWVAIADIKDYFNNISIKNLQDKIIQLLSKRSSPIFERFIKEIINNIDIGNRTDAFFQNLVLMDLDGEIENSTNIYGRITDDFRIYGESEQDVISSYNKLKELISNKGFEINTAKQFVKEVFVHKANSEYYGNKNSNELWKITPYLNLNEIHLIENENVLRIFSHTFSFNIKNRFFEDTLPKRITLIDEINGKSGFKINGIDLYDFIFEIENSSSLYCDIKFLEDIGKAIRYSFGNQNHYRRIVKCFFKIIMVLEKNDLEQALVLISEIFYSENTAKFIRYLFLFELFLVDDQNGNNLYFTLVQKNRKIERIVFNVIFYSLKNKDFWLSIENSKYPENLIRYVIDMKLYKVDGLGQNLLLNEKIWLEQLNQEIENNKYWDVEIDSIIDLLLDNWFPLSKQLTLLKAKAFFQKKDYDQAKIYFLNYFNLEDSKEKYETYFYYAYCLNELGETEDSLKFYSLYLRKYHSSSARNNRALIFEKLYQISQAEEDYLEAIKLNPEKDLYFKNLFDLYLKQNRGNDILNLLSQKLIDREIEFLKIKAKALASLNRKEESIIEINFYCKTKNWTHEDIIQREVNEVLEYIPNLQ